MKDPITLRLLPELRRDLTQLELEIYSPSIMSDEALRRKVFDARNRLVLIQEELANLDLALQSSTTSVKPV